MKMTIKRKNKQINLRIEKEELIKKKIIKKKKIIRIKMNQIEIKKIKKIKNF